MPERKTFRSFKKREPVLSTEQKIEKFIIRNSQNGFFTKFSTILYKFEISEDTAWSLVGGMLSGGLFESVHDEHSGEMKLCEIGKTYQIMGLEKKRRKDRNGTRKNYTSKKHKKGNTHKL